MSKDELQNNFKAIRRKIQVVGGNTITVSLPRSWAKKNRLGKGVNEEQEISMLQHPDGSLIVSPANSNKLYIERLRIHQIRSTTNIETLKRILLADYVGGIDVIKLRLSKQLPVDVQHELQNFVDKRLIGFDIIEMEKAIEVINMSQAPKFDVNRLMEIIRVQSTKMVTNCFQWIKDESIDTEQLYAMMSDWEIIIDRQSNQMMRTLQLSLFDFWMAEKVNLPMSEILYWSTVNKAAESAADLAFAIASLAPIIASIRLSNTTRNDLYKLAQKSSNLFSKSMKSFLLADKNEAHNVLVEQAETSIKIQQKWPFETVEGLSTNVTLMIRHLEKIAIYARKIAEATIDCEAARIAYQANK